jgi:hypothetical protein
MSQIILDNARNVVVSVDAAYTLDLTTLSGSPTRVTLEKLWYDTGAVTDAALQWQATANELLWKCTGTHSLDFQEFGGIPNNAGAGVTGNVIFAGTGTFSIVARFKKG